RRAGARAFGSRHSAGLGGRESLGWRAVYRPLPFVLTARYAAWRSVRGVVVPPEEDFYRVHRLVLLARVAWIPPLASSLAVLCSPSAAWIPGTTASFGWSGTRPSPIAKRPRQIGLIMG